ncbi:MAG: single-stranded-DNA-specific exonuclease RecJ [Bacteroidia bacterium]|nr:single-stranded-DNA-specific exonuclease RecJ [Bacteroidia bacterium]
MKQTRWILKEQKNEQIVDKLVDELKIDRVLCELLVRRGIRNFEEAKAFFRPTLNMLHDPFLMKDMDKAVERFEKAVASNEKIIVYGDYDVDGTTAVALAYTFLKELHDNIEYYIPDRYKEGYGISKTGIDVAAEKGATLMIALDCGVKANDLVEYAKSKGIDFIICDHHRPGDKIPDAVAVLDPKRDDCTYPFDELSGCGIGFKFIQAIALNRDLDSSLLIPYLDLVAVSTAADIVPIVGENRVLAYYGLKVLNSDPRPGLKAIIELSGIRRELRISDVVFFIAPKINAAGRMTEGSKAVDLLISSTNVKATSRGEGIDLSNRKRKQVDSEMTQEAIRMLESDPLYEFKKSTVVYKDTWHKGVVGIVAARLIDQYYRPTIVLCQSNDHVAGSARSVKGFDVYNAIEECSDLLEQFGGHKYAAGLTMKKENIEAFTKKFEEVVSRTISAKQLSPEIEIESEIDLDDITPSFFRILKQFEPFGPGNMSPVFKTSGVRDNGTGKIVGQTHLKMAVTQNGNKTGMINSIAFQKGPLISAVSNSEGFDICYEIEENHFNGRVDLQLNIKDIKFN